MIRLSKGDKVAIVSLSSGVLGEKFCEHQLELGIKRIRDFGLEPVFGKNSLKGLKYISEHPEKRAEDLIDAFKDNEIKGIICAIGGVDTYRIAPHLLTDENKKIIKKNPKFFMGYSDSTVDHLMLYGLGLNTYYGLSFLTCFAELDKEMLEYSKNSFSNIFTDRPFIYEPSKIWFEERSDFSKDQLGKPRTSHIDNKGYVLLQGESRFSGKLIGGCLESIYELLTGERVPDEKEINSEYGILPDLKSLEGAVLFLETSEEKPTPEKLKIMLETLKEKGMLRKLNGILVGKPQNNMYYEEYAQIYRETVPSEIPVLYNVNFGHAYPKMLLQYGATAEIDSDKQQITIERL